MFQLCEELIRKGTVNSERDFLIKIGFKTIPPVYQIKDGRQSFRHHHLLNAAELYDRSMDWFYGRTDKKPFKGKEKASAVDLLQDAITIIKKSK